MAITTNMTNEEIREEIYNLRRALRADIAEVKQFSKTSAVLPKYAVNRMAKVEKAMKEKAVKYMDRKELTSTLRELRDIRALKSSTKAGALETAENFEPIKYQLERLPQELQDKFWEVYGEVAGSTGTDFRLFKYTAMHGIMTMIDSGIDENDLAEMIELAYRKTQITTEGGGDSERANLLFSEFMSELFPKY